MNVLMLNHLEVKQLLPMKECIDVMEEALKILARGEADIPLRSLLWLPEKVGLLGMMPGYVGGDIKVIGIKAISVFPGNIDSKYDSHQGMVILFETKNGCPLAVIDANEITAMRTAAVSAVATKHLARPDASDLAILGSGTQAGKHLEAMLLVRPINRIRVWSLPLDHAHKFAEKKSKQHGIKVEFMETSQSTVQGADIICTTTSATEPILFGESIKEGVHINAVGSCVPHARELDTKAIVKSKVFVDSRESALNESGDFLIPKKEEAISDDHILGELGEVLLGRLKGRTSEQDITLFDSLGLAIEDLASANYIYKKALDKGSGISVEWGGLRNANH